ncbi:hypothetical protein [Deinococcus humi]|uniref:Uncharacterized protein n=1 Tax=Deinococcus humi TaxID=662880 RepID=A0A7W8NFT9_9DEIO|nr:hypothetical protein [Deinococcus humi]MBB5363103.1 hypothetical protein [Deinococcus humi]GGO24681.1 hypothetical protein GCM10008949_13830 [Deinococcus humi]
MQTLSELAAWWNTVYNGTLIHDPNLSYIVVSVLRLLIAWAAWRFLSALGRYLRVAFPRPHTPPNIVHWVRWWLWLRLQEFGLFKIGVAMLAVLLALQIPAGVAGTLAGASAYLLLAYPAMLAMLVGGAQLFNRLTQQIQHPEVQP